MLRFVEAGLGSGGPPRCVRCHAPVEETLRGASEVVAEVTQVAQTWGSGPGPNVSFTGVEPFRHPALPDILAGAVQAGVRRIRLESDAAALCSPEAATEAIRAGVLHLRVTVLGATASAHDALAGRTSADGLERTLAGIGGFVEAAEALNAPIQVTARVPVCRHNFRDLPAIVTAMATARVSSVLLLVDDPRLDLRTAAPWIEAACDTGVVNATWVEVEGVPFGLASGWELHMAAAYRRVEGMKSARCDGCPLSDLCQGAVLGAAPEVVGAFRPPEHAERLAEGLTRGFSPPCGLAS